MLRECSFAPTAKQCQGDDKIFDKKTDAGVNKLNKIAQRVLDLANGIPCKRQCRAMASEYIRGFADWKITKLPNVAERILDRANGKLCQSQRPVMAGEYMCGLLIGSVLSA